MEFELFVCTTSEYREFLTKIHEIMSRHLQCDIKSDTDEDGAYFSCEYFTITIFENSDLEYIEEQYDVKASYCIDINLFSKVYEQGLCVIFKMISELLEITSGDILFLGNGSIELFKRTQRGVLAKNNSYYNFQFPFHEIDVSLELK